MSSYYPKHIGDFKIGDSNSFTKTVTETDIVLFAGLVNDFNPLHMDSAYAATTPFQGRIAHGAFVESLTSGVAGSLLGMGAVHISHTMRFPAPTRFGDTITAKAEVVDIELERRRVTLKITCTNQDGVLVLTDVTEAIVKCRI